jgi:ABC-type transport system involved in multi-copper enzyme maturation permease subunit
MFGQVLITEVMKLRRSKVPALTLVALFLGPLGIALFMWIVREPGRAAQLGLLGTKANLAGIEATWPAFASMLAIIVGAGGMLLLAFIVAYVFGREYSDATAKNMLALPVRREWFALGKLVVAAAWWAVLVVAVLGESLVIGAALGLPGFSAALFAGAVVRTLLAAGIAFLLAPMVAWVTVLGRGYLPPLGFALLTLALGNLFSKTGWASWFPWSVIPQFIGMLGTPEQALPAHSVVVAALTFVAGVGLTLAQLRSADDTD